MISVANKILIPKKDEIVWDYEGIMTVGNFSIYYGYLKEIMGVMNPTNPQIDGFNETTFIYYFVNEGSDYLIVGYQSGGQLYNGCNHISIDGTIFSNFTNGSLEVDGNPFPSIGETCEIKMA